MYVITDKTIYTPGEVIWFSGYFLPQEGLADSLNPNVMAVALIRQDTTGYTINQNYFMRKHFCPGSLTLPAALQPGNYELVAALNLLDSSGRPRFSFRKRISVKTVEQPPFLLTFRIEDSLAATNTIQIAMQALKSEGVLIDPRNAAISYHRPGEKPKTQKLDLTGRARLVIPTDGADTTLPVLYTTTTVNGQSRSFTVWLPVQRSFTNKELLPAKKDIPRDKSATITLPNPLCGDTLEATITTSHPQKLLLASQNLYSATAERSAPVLIPASKKIALPLKDLTRGIHTLLLLNEHGIVLDQKQFFAHYSDRHQLSVQTGRNQFGTREKITLTISLKNLQGKPARALLTVTCVNTNRLEKNDRLLFPAYYYTQLLDEPYKTEAIYTNSRLLSQMLQQPVNTDHRPFSTDGLYRPQMATSIVFARNGKQIKKKLAVYIRSDTTGRFTATDNSGRFYPSAADLTVPEGSPFFVKAGNITKRGKVTFDIPYAVAITNPMQRSMTYLEQPELPLFHKDPANQTSSKQILNDPYEVKMMQMVTVQSKFFSLTADDTRRNNCGDYVCLNNILNCPAHLDDVNNTLPVKGKYYLTRAGGNNIIYQGCTENTPARINTPRSFTGMNENRLQNKEVPHYLSTLYWAPLLQVSGKITLEFYSSDLPGRYKIIAEGLAENGDILREEKEITIDDKQP
ncbi:hypothetical protein [Niabella drilacis]|uniref:hypothetical protein n=1 Tax=Niabella drilacis (strain DSM 25811 / CCM 8410 / CCUG 62505 / LMG 26954 / E90) TaxID=1285928 RepID=UPI00115FDF3C|nr:hypothetical protein [Niabella drilacis]